MNPTVSPGWMNVDQAAAVLDILPITLRRSIERNARRGPNGTVEAKVDGIHARKFGRRWRVALDDAWRRPTGGVMR